MNKPLSLILLLSGLYISTTAAIDKKFPNTCSLSETHWSFDSKALENANSTVSAPFSSPPTDQTSLDQTSSNCLLRQLISNIQLKFVPKMPVGEQNSYAEQPLQLAITSSGETTSSNSLSPALQSGDINAQNLKIAALLGNAGFEEQRAADLVEILSAMRPHFDFDYDRLLNKQPTCPYFAGADLTGANFASKDLSGTSMGFKSALSDIAQLSEFLDGSNAQLAIIDQTVFDKARLDHADFMFTVIKDASFKKVTARGALFYGAVIENTSFEGMQGQSSNFEGAELSQVSLRDAHLEGAVFKGCTFNDVDVRGAVFDGADFTDADLGNVDFRQASIKNVILPEVHIEASFEDDQESNNLEQMQQSVEPSTNQYEENDDLEDQSAEETDERLYAEYSFDVEHQFVNTPKKKHKKCAWHNRHRKHRRWSKQHKHPKKHVRSYKKTSRHGGPKKFKKFIKPFRSMRLFN